jgi:hypothetical protein
MSTMMEQVLSDNVIFLRREKDLHLGKPGQGNDQTRQDQRARTTKQFSAMGKQFREQFDVNERVAIK